MLPVNRHIAERIPLLVGSNCLSLHRLPMKLLLHEFVDRTGPPHQTRSTRVLRACPFEFDDMPVSNVCFFASKGGSPVRCMPRPGLRSGRRSLGMAQVVRQRPCRGLALLALLPGQSRFDMGEDGPDFVFVWHVGPCIRVRRLFNI